MEKNKLLFKILGITLLITGFVLIIFGVIDMLTVSEYNSSLIPGEELKKVNIMWSLIATPCMFGGFFFFVLGFGKKKEYGK